MVGGKLCYWVKPVHVQDLLPVMWAANPHAHRERFKVFSGMHRVWELERIVKIEMMNGRLDHLQYEPLIISEIRSPRNRISDDCAGKKWGSPIYASAL